MREAGKAMQSQIIGAGIPILIESLINSILVVLEFPLPIVASPALSKLLLTPFPTRKFFAHSSSAKCSTHAHNSLGMVLTLLKRFLALLVGILIASLLSFHLVVTSASTLHASKNQTDDMESPYHTQDLLWTLPRIHLSASYS